MEQSLEERVTSPSSLLSYIAHGITVVILAIVLFVGSELMSVSHRLTSIETTMESEAKYRGDRRRLETLELAAAEARISARVDQYQSEITTLGASVQRNEDLMGQIWPRLRAASENVDRLATKVEEVCQCDIELKSPDAF